MTETVEPVTEQQVDDPVDQQQLAEQLLAQARQQGFDLVGLEGLLNTGYRFVVRAANREGATAAVDRRR